MSEGPSYCSLNLTQAAWPPPPSAHAETTLRTWPQGTACTLAPSLRSEQKAPLEPIQAGTATPLALEHLQAMNVALHWAIAPASCQASFDGVVVVAQSFRKALQGHEGAIRRPCQPGIQLICPPLAHERGKVLG